MACRARLLSTATALVLLCGTGSGQRQTGFPRTWPPDIVENSSIDVARISPESYSVEFQNQSVRVLRARVAPQARVPTHAHPAGLIVAISVVHLRLAMTDGRTVDVHILPGQTKWLDREIHAEINLAAEECEFLVIEPSGRSPIPYRPLLLPAPARR